MPIKNRFITQWLVLMVLIAGFGVMQTSAQNATSHPVDVMLVLDNSGSMKQNDPNRLVKQAVSEFASHLQAQSQLGIIVFDQRVDLVMGLTKVSDPEFQSKLSQSLDHVDYSGKWTDIPGGIERAIYTLKHEGRPDAMQAIVFFTDGIIETGNVARDLERSKWLRENLAAEAKQQGIRIFGVAFTEAADYQLIQSVAQTTGGEHYRILKSSDVADTFGQIAKRILEPLPVATATPAVAAPVQKSPWSVPVRVGSGLGLVLLVILVILLFMRRNPDSRPQAPSEDIPPADFAHLIDVGRHTGAERIPVRKRRVRIGRDSKLNDVYISEETVSLQHAVIEYREDCFFLRDLRSSNGTFVNGKQISDPASVQETMLKTGDRIRFDAYEFVFNLDASAGAATPGAKNVPEHHKTALRRGPVPQVQQLQPQRPAAGAAPALARVPPAPAIQKAEHAPDAPAGTRVRTEFCPTHPSWNATELCPKCGIGKCKQCMTEKDGKAMCVDCANQVGD